MACAFIAAQQERGSQHGCAPILLQSIFVTMQPVAASTVKWALHGIPTTQDTVTAFTALQPLDLLVGYLDQGIQRMFMEHSHCLITQHSSHNDTRPAQQLAPISCGCEVLTTNPVPKLMSHTWVSTSWLRHYHFHTLHKQSSSTRAE